MSSRSFDFHPASILCGLAAFRPHIYNTSPKQMPKVFSFCLYGTDKKYYHGLLKNIALIHEYYPDYEVWVYVSKTNHLPSPVEEIASCARVVLQWSDSSNGCLMYERYLPLEDPTVEVCFVRDADSRVDERDRWCITEFLKSDKQFHTIRDHYWHKSRLSGGMTGWRGITIQIRSEFPAVFAYGDDEKFLNQTLHTKIWGKLLVHTNMNAYLNETAPRIALPRKSEFDFVGQVYSADDTPQFSYNQFPKSQQIQWLLGQNQYELLDLVYDMWRLDEAPYEERSGVLDAAFISNWYLRKYEKCQQILKGFEIAEITQHVVFNSSFILDYWEGAGYSIVGTTDPGREPGEKEVVIVYGCYPHWYHMLPHSRKMFRNVQMLFDRPRHTTFEWDACWDSVDQIYILNLEERHDRFVETCLELARLRAPMNKITHYKAKKDGRKAYYGATKNHVDAVEMFEKSSHTNCLVLEDDFCFTSSVDVIKAALTKFWATKYDYQICFLAASKSGRRDIHDDLLLRTQQVCTTSSAYFLSKPRSAEVLEVIREGYTKMCETGDTNTYCIDRYWHKISGKGKMFIFREKLGFQRASYSNIQSTVVYNLD